MSAIADRMRSRRHTAAAPGSSRDRVVRILSIALPSAIGVMAAFLILAPLTKKGEVSFLLDKNSVEVAKERMRVDNAEYRGEDDKGRAFTLNAGSALQKSSAVQVVQMKGLSASLDMKDGEAILQAGSGSYDIDQQKVKVDGPVVFDSAGGYRLKTRDVDVDLGTRKMESRGPVSGSVPSGTFRADKLTADMEDRTVVLQGNAKLRMQPGSKGIGF